MPVFGCGRKSTLQRMESEVPLAVLAAAHALLLNTVAAVPPTDGPSLLGLAEPVDLAVIWMDSTCVQLDIHYPTDWVLLRDATRTSIKAIMIVRSHGFHLKNAVALVNPPDRLLLSNCSCFSWPPIWCSENADVVQLQGARCAGMAHAILSFVQRSRWAAAAFFRFKNDFIGGHLPTKGFDQQQRYIAWAALAHNLWVLSRREHVDTSELARAS